MKREEIYKKLTEIFRDVFDDETLIINDNTSADDIDEWDSLSHISLISAIEYEFDFRFDMKAVQKLENVGQMVDLISDSIN